MLARPIEAHRRTCEWVEAHRWFKTYLPIMLMVAIALWYFIVFEQLVWNRHTRFGTFDYDLGMYDQGIWQLAHGRGFMTVRGMHVFGHHANIGYLLLVPFYWVGLGGPQFLNFVNIAGVVAVTLPIFALARTHLKSSWAGLFLGIAYLFHFSPQWKIHETFHPESLAAPALAGALYFASVGKWRHYGVCLIAAAIWKEDIALATAMLGLVVAVLFRQPKIGAITFGASMVWFIIATQLIMSRFNPDGAVFDSLFGPLGQTAPDVVRTSIVHPSRLWRTVNCHGFFDGKLRALDQPVTGVRCPTPADAEALNQQPRGLSALMAPYGFTSVLNLPALSVGIPQHTVNSATSATFTWDLRFHYAFIPYLGVLFSSVLAVVRRSIRAVSWVLIVIMLAGVFKTADQGVGPWTERAGQGWWPLETLGWHQDSHDALAEIDDDAAVSASYYFVPHIAHRTQIYTFPNPWKRSNYGAGNAGAAAPDANEIDDVVVNVAGLNEADTALFEAIAVSGQFEAVSERKRNQDGLTSRVVHLRRVKEGPPIQRPVAPN